MKFIFLVIVEDNSTFPVFSTFYRKRVYENSKENKNVKFHGRTSSSE